MNYSVFFCFIFVSFPFSCCLFFALGSSSPSLVGGVNPRNCLIVATTASCSLMVEGGGNQTLLQICLLPLLAYTHVQCPSLLHTDIPIICYIVFPSLRPSFHTSHKPPSCAFLTSCLHRYTVLLMRESVLTGKAAPPAHSKNDIIQLYTVNGRLVN